MVEEIIFFVSGRITYDHRRPSEEEISWGNKLMLLPEIENFTLLAIESALYTTNKVAIPYPTYFHPSNESQVASWQETVRSMDRPWLFSFTGARRHMQTTSIRDHLIDQCTRSDECRLLQCNQGKNNCQSPTRIIKLFKHSKFCLQPTGDSFTRRSTFDSILSEEEVRERKVSIEEALLKYSKEQEPRYEVESVRDAFDIAIDGVIERVQRLKAT
ncbi:xyloglucan galactosyltransferase MUR3-like [Carex rostrata]